MQVGVCVFLLNIHTLQSTPTHYLTVIYVCVCVCVFVTSRVGHTADGWDEQRISIVSSSSFSFLKVSAL